MNEKGQQKIVIKLMPNPSGLVQIYPSFFPSGAIIEEAYIDWPRLELTIKYSPTKEAIDE